MTHLPDKEGDHLMPDNTLRQRIEDELVGEDLEKRHVRIRKNTHGSCCQCQTCGEDHDECILNRSMDEDELRGKQRQALPATLANIEADLKGLLPEEKPASASVYNAHNTDNRTHFCDYTLQIQLNNEVNKGYNQAIADITAAIERYCRNGEGSE